MFNGNREWKLHVRVWVESEERNVLGPGRVELLELIDRLRSISAAAKQMSMSYRRAWELVRAVNTAAGEQYVETSAGGSHGGGATLTPRGREAVAEYRRLCEQLLHAVEQIANEPSS